MNDFDHDSAALFRAARDAADPDPGAEVRIRKALSVQLGAAAFIVSGAKGAAVATSKGGASLGGLWAKTAAHFAWAAKILPIALVPVVGGGAVVSYRYLARTQATTAAAISTPMASPRVVERLARPVATEGPAATEPLATAEIAAAPVIPAPAARRAQTPQTPSTAPSTLSDEVTLVARMHELWRAGDLTGLDRAIADHQRRFPRGILAEERDAMKAMLICRRVSPARASEVAAAFAAEHTGSPHIARVNAVCNEQQR
jgi:hypothetical protein